jgi:hypothetical protein
MSSKRLSSKKSAGKKSAGKKSAGKKSADKKSADKKSADKKSPTNKSSNNEFKKKPKHVQKMIKNLSSKNIPVVSNQKENFIESSQPINEDIDIKNYKNYVDDIYPYNLKEVTDDMSLLDLTSSEKNLTLYTDLIGLIRSYLFSPCAIKILDVHYKNYKIFGAIEEYSTKKNNWSLVVICRSYSDSQILLISHCSYDNLDNCILKIENYPCSFQMLQEVRFGYDNLSVVVNRLNNNRIKTVQKTPDDTEDDMVNDYNDDYYDDNDVYYDYNPNDDD